MRLLILLCCLGLPLTGHKPSAPRFSLREAFPNLTVEQPVELIYSGDGTNRVFVLSQPGVIHVFANRQDVSQSQEFLDLTSGVVSGGERGLLGLAFHPNYQQNGYFFVNYTRGDPLETVISRFQVSKTNPDRADPGSELVLLTYRQPYNNHNGGKIAFGPDGYLYISAGDGGSGGDPQNNAQDLTKLLGKIMRIDVDRKAGNLNYAIPEDNPYRGNKQGFREEIYAYGLRNVWKFSFDRTTGKLWAGDVGQNAREEISIIEKGGNYGWKIMEGMVCYTGKNSADNQPCNTAKLIKPVYEYLHAAGTGTSITGGIVYRGKAIPSLKGSYIYGDYTTGMIWALTLQADGKVTNELLMDSNEVIAAFGEDAGHELYVCSYGSGKIFRLTTQQQGN